MKVSKKQLRRIIKEEKLKLLREQMPHPDQTEQWDQWWRDNSVKPTGPKVASRSPAPQARAGGSSADGGAAERAISAAGLGLRPADAGEIADAQVAGFQALGTVGSDYLMGYGILVMTDGSSYYMMYRETDWEDWGPLSLQKMVDELLYEEDEGNLD